MPSRTASPSQNNPGPRDPTRLHVWQIQGVRDVLIGAVILFLFWIGYALRAVSVPLLVALLLAYLFEPLIAATCRRVRVSRTWVVSGLVTSFVIVLAVMFAIVVPVVIGQTVRFANDVRDGRLQSSIVGLREHVPERYRSDYDTAMQFFTNMLTDSTVTVDESMDKTDDDELTAPLETTNGATPDDDPDQQSREHIRELIRAELQSSGVTGQADSAGRDVQFDSWVAIIKRSGTAVVNFFAALLQVGFLLFLIPFYFFFFSLWYPNMVEFCRNLIPEANKERTLELLRKMDDAVSGFVRGRIVISLLMGVLFAIGWSICGVPYAIVVGLVIGIFSAVPYLGGVGIPVAIGLLWISELNSPADERMNWIWIIAGPSLVFAVVQVIESWILTPAIQGKATNLDPVTILVAVLAGGSVLGVYGMLLAIPIAACGKILITDVLMPRIKDWSEGKASDPLPISND